MNNNNFQEISEVSKRHEAVRAAFETLDIYSDKDFFSDCQHSQIDEVTEQVKAALTAVQELCTYYEVGGILKRKEMDGYYNIALDSQKKLHEIDFSKDARDWQEICFKIIKRIHDMKSKLGLFGEASTPPHEIDEKGEERIKSLERRSAQGGEASTPPPLRPDEINEVRIKSLFLPYRHKSAEAFIKHLQAAMAEQYYTPDFKKYEKISLAIIMVKTYLNAVTASKAARAQILIPKAQKSWDYFQKEVFESLGETSPRYRKDIIKDKS